jgi:D-alanyl-D-alanine carboxypeptidase
MTVRTLVGPSLLLALGAVSAPAQQTSRASLETRIDSLATAFITNTRTPAVSVAVLRGSDTLVMKGYGEASVEAHRPATASTVYRIGSITKQFTSAAIMRLIERGKLSLDDPMSKYLPDVPLHGHTVTIRQLLNHTSGIHSYTSEPEWQKTWSKDLTPRQIVAFVDKDTFDFAPGTGWRYNNTGYVLLGMIIEKITGESYASYLQHEFVGGRIGEARGLSQHDAPVLGWRSVFNRARPRDLATRVGGRARRQREIVCTDDDAGHAQ